MVLFLKYDPKDIIITLGGLIWGPLPSFTVSVVVSMIEMVTISENGILGCIMNIVSSCSFACTAAVIYKKKRTLKGAVIGLLAGSVAMVLVVMLWNYLIAPIYMAYPREAVAKLLIPAFLPFNLLKSGLNAGFIFLLYKPITTALRRTGYLSESAVEQNKKPVGLWLFFGVVIITCILLIISLNGVIQESPAGFRMIVWVNIWRERLCCFSYHRNTFIAVDIPDRSFPIHTAHLKSVSGCSLFR